MKYSSLRVCKNSLVLLLGLVGALYRHQSFGDNPSLNLQTFQPALGPDNIIAVEGTRTPALLVPSVSMWLDWAFKPLKRWDTLNQRSPGDVISNFGTWHVTGGVSVRPWLFIAVDIPIVIYQDFSIVKGTYPESFGNPTEVSAGIADLRLSGKFRLINNQSGGFGISILSQFSFPTGDDQGLRGNGAVLLEPKVALDYRFWKSAFVALNVGFVFRTADQTVENFRISQQIRYGLGIYVPLPLRFGVMAELTGSTSLINGPEVYSPLEFLFGARWEHSSGLGIGISGGAGLTHAIGLPAGRVMFSLSYTRMPAPKKMPTPIIPVSVAPKPIPQATPSVSPIIEVAKAPLPPVRVPTPPPPPVENLDPDGDGVLGSEDKCPLKAGPKGNRGCPVEPKFVVVTKERLEIKHTIRFVTNSAVISKASYELLDEVAVVLKEHPMIHVRIEGYADNRGSKKQNFQISQARADEVRDYLAKKGIERIRLLSVGRGVERPLGDNGTLEGQDKNRRVEFIITQQ